MKALTIQQPYASLIANGEKWVENRSWPTVYRGPLAIHTGKTSVYMDPGDLKGFPTGVVLAVAQLVACVHLPSMRAGWPNGSTQLSSAGITLKEFLSHTHTEGPWCWVLRDVRPLPTPVPRRGKQGLWEWHCAGPADDLVVAVAEEVERFKIAGA